MTASKKEGKFCRQLQITLPAGSTIYRDQLLELFTSSDELQLYQNEKTKEYSEKALRSESTDSLIFEFYEQREVKASRKAVQPLLHNFLVSIASKLWDYYRQVSKTQLCVALWLSRGNRFRKFTSKNRPGILLTLPLRWVVDPFQWIHRPTRCGSISFLFTLLFRDRERKNSWVSPELLLQFRLTQQ